MPDPKDLYHDIIVMLLMRWIALVLFIALASGIAQGYPLHASNGIINCTIFGSFKDPWPSGSSNADSYVVLNVDLSLLRINGSDKTPIRAAYSLMDGNDRVFKMVSEYTKELQPGRRLIGFVVPRETIAKSLIVDLSSDPDGGEKFSIYFPELINSSNENVTMLYYGVLQSRTNSNRKTIELDVAVTNNGTEDLLIDAKNFTLRDQWGWKYDGNQYGASGKKSVPASVLVPNGTIRSGLVFSSISPLSRAVELDYRYSNDSYLALNIDPESGLCADNRSLGCDECNSSGEQGVAPDATSLAGSLKSSTGRLDKADGNTANRSPPKGRDEL